ncbi:MAG: response regulator, partial [Pseudomonadota bacterium]|nr:response regulator [Pseudomonadota bacterium]
MKSDHFKLPSIRTVINRMLITHQVIFFVMIALIMAGAAYLGGQNQLEELNQTTHLLTKLVAEHIDSANRVISVLAAQSPDQKDLDTVTETYAAFDVLYHLDQDGILVGISPQNKQNLLGMDMSAQPYFTPAQGGLVISDPFISTHTGNPTVYLSLPIANQGGAVVGELSLTNLQESVIRENISKIGTFYILDQNGYLLAHPQYDRVRLYESSSQLEIIEDANQGKKYQVFLSEGELLVAMAVAIPRTKWVAITQAPLMVVYGPYLIPAISGLLLGLILFVVIGKRERAGITRKVVDPLSELSQEVESLAVGDHISRSVLHQPATIAEVYSLAESFELMKDAVQSREAALKEGEERFRYQTEFLQNVLNSLTHPFYVIDAQDHRVIMTNEAAYSGPLPKNITCHALLHGSEQPCELTGQHCPLLEVKNTKEPVAVEHIHIDKTGQPRHYEVRGFPVLDQSGEVMQMIEYSLDITERKLIEEQQQLLVALEERERIGRELHDDLGQVMSYVSVQAQTALHRLDNHELNEAHVILNQLAEVAQKAFSDVRKYILGIRTDEYQPPADFFVELDQLLDRQKQHYGLDIQVSRPDEWWGSPFAPEVETQLLRIIQEALTNVRKHAGVATARLIFTEYADQVQVIVEDDGRGFAPRPDTDTTVGPESVHDPNGHFGLAIMSERAAVASGRLELRSAPGEGTRVIIYLPRAISQTEKSSKEAARGVRVLLVDDHPLYLEGLQNLLVARGMHVVGQAYDGLEAQILARDLRPDLILMDLHMPRCDGLEATRVIKSELPEVKIVMLTVAADDKILFEALKSGASGYLLKSLDRSQFFILLGQVLQGETVLSPGLASRVLSEMAGSESAG